MKEKNKILVSDSLSVKYRPQKLENMIGNEVAKAAVSGMLARKTFPNTMLLHGGTGMGKCVIGSTLIHTAEGMLAIESLVQAEDGFSKYLGPRVINAYGRLEKPDAGFRKITESTIKLTTYFGGIEGTPEHPMLGLVDGVLGYHRLEEYSTGDKLAVPKVVNHLTCKITNQNRQNYFSLGAALCATSVGTNRFQTINFVASLLPDAKGIFELPEKYKTEECVANCIRQGLPDAVNIPVNAYEFIRGLIEASHQSINTNAYSASLQLVLPTNKIAKQVSILLMIWNIRTFSFEKIVVVNHDVIELANIFGLRKYYKPKSFETRYVGNIKIPDDDRRLTEIESDHFRELQRFSTITSTSVINEPKIVYDLSMPNTHSFQTECMISHNTTMARMLGRYANCDTGDSCGTCPSCMSGDSNPDILEMNMATERGIDEIRSLIQKSKLAPRFNKRVFILDELHQCFAPDTKVLMADKTTKNICDIEIGDKVCGFDHSKNNIVSADVTNTHSHFSKGAIVKVSTIEGSVICTHDHKWWSETRKSYTKAFNLKTNELLKTFDGQTTVNDVTILDVFYPNSVVDITVPLTSNFFVQSGDKFVLVHNCTPQAKEALLKPLEEPAKNTMWILCTTEPEKLTKTILGRCQQINMSAPTQKELVSHLRYVCREENVKINAERLPLLKYIAEASMGHSRNALQMLETFINLVAGNKEFSIEKIQSLLTSSGGGDNDELAAHLLAHVLLGDGKEAVKLLYQAGQNKDVMGIIFKMRWLIDYKLNNWAGISKFNPHIHQIFEKKFGKKPINVSHLIKILGSLVDCEIKIKTVSGLDDRIYFTSKILNDMLDIVK